MVAVILEITREEPFSTLVKIKEKLEARLPSKPHIHVSTIARHLENQLISLKIAGKDADVPFKRNIASTKELRFENATWLAALPIKDIIYVDECGINLFTRRTQGGAPIGEPVRQCILAVRMATSALSWLSMQISDILISSSGL